MSSEDAQMDTTPATPAPVEAAPAAEPPSPEPLLAAFEALPEEHKAAIQAKVMGLQSQLEEAQAAKESAEAEATRHREQAENLTADATRDKELFKSRLEALAEELSSQHPAAAQMIQATYGIAQQHPAAQLVAERMVRACSEILSGQPAMLGRKRAKTEAPVVQRTQAVAKPAAPTPERSTTTDKLRNFLTSMDTI